MFFDSLKALFLLKKSEARSLFDGSGVQFPGTAVQDGLIHSIFDAGAKVNRKLREQTETRQFKRWFGNSRMADENGKPMTVYHGTNAKRYSFFRMTESPRFSAAPAAPRLRGTGCKPRLLLA